MKRFFFSVLFMLPITHAAAEILHVGSSWTYPNLQQAAAVARPGDTILIHGGVYQGGQYVTGLRGSQDSWIFILAADGEEVVFRGAAEAWHLTDVAYLRISGFRFEGQTGNGVNIDDGGSYDTPSHSLIIENCEWGALLAGGNNDQLKLSGVDTFIVRNCRFLNGSAGGSAVDMVGCHHGSFTENRFENAGSNSIQSKGGSQYIRIERNRFLNGGQRSLNIGGSTGPQYFRPLNANFEASHIFVYSNIFSGSIAPIAFVGAVHCIVSNNTLYMPEKWAIRILQETSGAAYLECGDNSFINNIVFLGNNASNPTLNIGPDTRPESFTFAHNLWYNHQSAHWQGPNLPVAESGGLIGLDPLLADPGNGDFSPLTASPAIGNGASVTDPVYDHLGKRYGTPRSIGAVEGAPPVRVTEARKALNEVDIHVFPNPVRRSGMVSLRLPRGQHVTIEAYDLLGRMKETVYDAYLAEGIHVIPIFQLIGPNPSRNAILFLMVRTAALNLMRRIVYLHD